MRTIDGARSGRSHDRRRFRAGMLGILLILPALLVVQGAAAGAIRDPPSSSAVLSALPSGGPLGRDASHERTLTWNLDSPGVVTLNGIDVSNGTARLVAGSSVVWTKKADATIQRNAHAMAVDPATGTIYTAAGHGTGFAHVNSLYAYTPSTGVWAAKTALPASGRMLTALAWDSTQQKLVLVGGYDPGFPFFKDTWFFDPVTNAWTQKADAPAGVHSGTLVYDKTGSQFFLWAFCQDKFYRFTPANNTWITLPGPAGVKWCTNPPDFAAGSSQTAFDPVHRRIVVFGGLQSSTVAWKATWLYDIASGAWSNGAAPPTPRYDGGAYVDESRGLVVAVAGKDDTGAYPSPATYDPGTDTWATEPSVAGMEDRYWTGPVWDPVGQRAVVFGGWGTTNIIEKDVWWVARSVAAAGSVTIPTDLDLDLVKLDALRWNATVPAGTSLKADVRSSHDGVTWSPWESVSQGGTVAKPKEAGPKVEIRLSFTSDGGSGTPSLDDVALDYTVDKAPTIDVGANITAHKRDQVPLVAIVADPDGEAVAVRWIQTAGAPLPILAPTTPAASVTPLATGAYTFRATATDPVGLSATDEVSLTVENRPPTANAGPDQEILKGGSATLIGTGIDEDSADTLSYLWSKTGGPTAIIDGIDKVTLTLRSPPVGIYTFTLVVSDGEATSPGDSVTVNVTTQVPIPALATATPSVVVGTEVIFDASDSEDRDGNVSAYQFDFGDDQVTDWLENAEVRHTYTKAGNYTARVAVRDDDRAESGWSDGLVMIVRPPNQPPTADPVATPASGTTLTEFGLAARAADPDGHIVEVVWVVEGSMLKGEKVTTTFDAPGEYTVKVRVRDDGGLVTERALTITVAAVPPTADLQLRTDRAIAGHVVQFDASGSDDEDGKVAGYRIDFGDGQTSNWVSGPHFEHTYDKAGTFVATLTVKDDDGALSAGGEGTRVQVVVEPARSAAPPATGLSSVLSPMVLILLVAIIVAVGLGLALRRRQGGSGSSSPPPPPPPTAPPMQMTPPPPPPPWQGSAPYGTQPYGLWPQPAGPYAPPTPPSWPVAPGGYPPYPPSP